MNILQTRQAPNKWFQVTPMAHLNQALGSNSSTTNFKFMIKLKQKNVIFFDNFPVKALIFTVLYLSLAEFYPGSIYWSYVPSFKFILHVFTPLIYILWAIFIYAKTTYVCHNQNSITSTLLPLILLAAIYLGDSYDFYAQNLAEIFIASLYITALFNIALYQTDKITKSTKKLSSYIILFSITALNGSFYNYIEINFTDSEPMDLVLINSKPKPPRDIIYEIPRSYLKNGKAIIILGALRLNFEKESLRPGLRVQNQQNIQSVSINLGSGWRKNNTTGMASSSYNPLTWNVSPTDTYYGLNHYAPDKHKYSYFHAHIYVPKTENPGFLFVCEGGPPPGKSSCRRMYTQGNTESTYMYWFKSSKLKDWQALESSINSKIQSFKKKT